MRALTMMVAGLLATATLAVAQEQVPAAPAQGGRAGGAGAEITAAANRLVAQRFLLQRDADLRIQQATATPVLP